MRAILTTIFLAVAALAWAPPAAAQDAAAILNGFRAEAGLAPLERSARLEQAAFLHATDMAQRRFFGHEGSDGSDVMARVRRTGYDPVLVAENIARGHQSLRAVLEGWMSSRGHRRNILLPEATEFGLVRAPGNLWVMVLARPRG